MEQTRAREAKVRLVGTILDRAGLARLYDSISVAEAERLYEALMDHASEVAGRALGLALEDVPGRREAAQMILTWCETMQHGTPAAGTKHHTEGWNAALQLLSVRIAREFGLS